MATKTPTAPPKNLPGEPAVTFALAEEHNLNQLEYDRIVAMLERTPTFTELGIFSALWSEHCSYKHSRPVLKEFPTTGEHVLQGPGENAGVLRLPDADDVRLAPTHARGRLRTTVPVA